MSELVELVERPTERAPAVRGRIAEAPADRFGELHVTIETFDGSRQRWGPCRWAPGSSLPQRGDECLVVFDERETPWVITDAPVEAAPEPGTGDLHYVHTQTSPSSSWTVTHGLGKYPAVVVVDTGDSVVLPDVRYLDANSVSITFASPTSGKAVCN